MAFEAALYLFLSPGEVQNVVESYQADSAQYQAL